MVQEVVHRWEYARVIRRRCHHELAHSERIFHSLSHIVAAQICHRDLRSTLCSQYLGQLLSRRCRASVNRRIGNENTLSLRLILAPRVVQTDVVTEIFGQDRTVQRTDHLDVERRQLFEQRLHGHAILSADVEVVTTRLARPLLVVFECAKFAKCVGRKDHLRQLIVRHHHLGPMHHWRHHKVQSVSA